MDHFAQRPLNYSFQLYDKRDNEAGLGRKRRNHLALAQSSRQLSKDQHNYVKSLPIASGDTSNAEQDVSHESPFGPGLLLMLDAVQHLSFMGVLG